jgi:hypothetical protein
MRQPSSLQTSPIIDLPTVKIPGQQEDSTQLYITLPR